MKKKILIVAVLIVILGAGFMFYFNYRNYAASPRGSAELSSGNLNVAITYCRPSVRGRLIFGEASQGALQPYGQYWRLGANDATEVTFNQDVLFNGQPVKKGSYRMYAVPGKDEFEISLNSELGQWGAFEPDYGKDILKTKVPTTSPASSVEQHTITLNKAASGPNAVDIVVEWSDTRFVIPVKAQ
jgi:hypothetical protein